METVRLNQQAISAMKHNRIDETIDTLKEAARAALDGREATGNNGAATRLLLLQLDVEQLL